MRYKFALFCSLLSLAFLGAGTPGVQADDTYRILDKAAAGDVSQNDDEFGMNITINVAIAGKPAASLPMTFSEQKKYLKTVLAIDSDGHEQAVRRTYRVAVDTEKSSDGEKTKVSSLQGKSVVIQRTGAKVSVKSEGGPLTEEDRKSLMDALDDKQGKLFPDRPLAIGEEWTPDPKLFAKKFAGADKVEIHVKLVDVVSFAGHQCAHFHMNLDVSMPQSKNVAVKMKLEGDGYQALDLQRPVSISLAGPVTASGAEKKDGLDFSYSGEGSAHMKLTIAWQKVAGKQVADKSVAASDRP